MPLSSLQTSGMIGGQVAMFGNQSQLSQQIGSLYGTGPGPTGGGMQAPPSYGGDPFNQTQDTGSKIAGAAGMMAPMAAAGIPLAAGMMGGAAGWADPFTGAWRGFARGVGAGGGGFGATMGQIGAGFSRGAGAGVARLGLGVAGASLAAAPAAIAGMAAVEAGQQFYQGVQTTQDMERVAGQMAGPQYGAGSRQGGKLDRGQIRQMVSVIEELADDNVMASVQTVTKLADKFSQMGMMSGSIDAASFKQKFSNMVKQTDIIAKMMGTSMEEAAPMLQKFQQMGMWTAGDIMGGSAAMKMVGPQGAQHLGGAMATGAQMVHGMGGRLGAGAEAGQKAFMNVHGAMNIGALSNQDVTEFTGGVGGRQGQQMVAQSMMGMTARLAQSPMGKLAVAGMGQFEDGEFTGKMDTEMMRKLKAGQLDIGDLEKRGRKLTGTREGAASYMMQQKKMQGELVGKGGLEGTAAMMQMVLDKSGHADSSDDIQATVLKHITGATERDVEMAMKMMEKLPQAKEDNRKRLKDMLQQRDHELDIRQNRSLAGAKDAIKQRWEAAWRPMRESGADTAQSLGESADEMWQNIMGAPSRDVNISQKERQEILSTTTAGDATGLQDDELRQKRLQLDTGAIERFSRGGFGALVGFDTAAVDTRKEALRHLGQTLHKEGGAGRYDLGGGVFADVKETNEARQRLSRLVNSGFSLSGSGYSSDPENAKNGEIIKRSMIQAASSDRGIRAMKARREGKLNEPQYRKVMMDIIKQEGGEEVQNAFDSLAEKRIGGPGSKDTTEMELASIVSAGPEGKSDVAGFRTSTEATARSVEVMPETREGLNKKIQESSDAASDILAKAAGTELGLLDVAAVSAATLLTFGAGAVPAALAVQKNAHKRTKRKFKDVLTGKKWSGALRDWLSSGAPSGDEENNDFLKAAMGLEGDIDPEAQKVYELIKSDPSVAEALKGVASETSKDIRSAVHYDNADATAAIAEEEELFADRATSALSPEQSNKYKEILNLYKSGNTQKQKQATKMTQELAGELSIDQAEAMSGAGGVARMIGGQAIADQLLQAPKQGLMGAGDFKKAMSRISGTAGYGVLESMSKEQRAEIQGMVESDGLDAGELDKIKSMTGKLMEKAGPQKSMRELVEQQKIVAEKFGTVVKGLTGLVTLIEGKVETPDPDSSTPADKEDKPVG